MNQADLTAVQLTVGRLHGLKRRSRMLAGIRHGDGFYPWPSLANPQATCHTFRHSFASDLQKQGTDIRTIEELLGHDDGTLTRIYTNVPSQEPSGVRSHKDMRWGAQGSYPDHVTIHDAGDTSGEGLLQKAFLESKVGNDQGFRTSACRVAGAGFPAQKSCGSFILNYLRQDFAIQAAGWLCFKQPPSQIKSQALQP